MNTNGNRRMTYRVLGVLTSTLLLAACGGLPAPKVVSQNIYVLEAAPTIQASQVKRDLVLAVSVPRARPGFDTQQMAYVQQPYELNYFVTSRWADTPARMLEPLIAQAIAQTESFRAVVQASGAIPADVRLDIELVSLQHDFKTRPSRVQLTLRAQLIDVRGKRLLAVQQFDEVENAASDDAYGGVSAANRLVQRVLGKLAEFCVNASVYDMQSGANRP
ncbi:MAG: ABC-type transport auxiliary lipoprotein family protein [Sideroxyarcus sp.]|nr:ABC-type transport auxiliary lipoprotein family protein [Sideroxyarcus sp.]